MFQVLNDLALSYLSRLTNMRSQNKRFQSAAQYEDGNIHPIFFRTSQALNSSFTATGPGTGISLQNDFKAEGNITEFKETHLFKRSYGIG